MPASGPPVTVRMYNVGFGDAFLVTVGTAPNQWRMLVDCGVHSHGQARPIAESVAAIVADLADSNGAAHLDAVVATHHHADHIRGFADEAWDTVRVDQVLLPWIEDPNDEVARELRTDLKKAADQIEAIARLRLESRRPRSATFGVLETSRILAANAKGNDIARDRLHGKSSGFVDPDHVRFLPRADEAISVIETDITDVRLHVVGPSRDEKMLRRMNPPKNVEWLAGVAASDPTLPQTQTLFDTRFTIDKRTLATNPRYREVMSQSGKRKGLRDFEDDNVLIAASKLERWCNNTSLFFVLEAGRKRLVFPGDAQQGAWEHVLSNPPSRDLLVDADFYKISHHGSHNGTPRSFVDEVFGDKHDAMLPYGHVKQWTKIPKATLLEGLEQHEHRIVRADEPQESNRVKVHADKLWSELRL